MIARFAGVSAKDARRGAVEFWILLSAGVSLLGATELAAFEAANRRELAPSFRTALIARNLSPALAAGVSRVSSYCPGHGQAIDRSRSRIAQRLRTRIKRRASRHYIIYQ
jgi:hypothetical protein